MPRVASLYLPNLAIDRIRRIDARNGRPRKSSPAFAGEGGQPQAGGGAAAKPPNDFWHPVARWSENSKERARRAELEERVAAGSPPHHGHWRPGARWAQGEQGSDEWLARRIARKAGQKAAIQAEIETLPLHQRPPMRELGRRSEAMPHPFRQTRPNEDEPAGTAYDLQGAFWQQGRSLGGIIARAVGMRERDEPRPGSASVPVDLPLVTAHRIGSRQEVAAACPAARALGLAPGMALAKARAMVPGLDIRPADPDGQADDLARLADYAARHWTPLVTVAPSEGLWLDIGASAHLFGGEAVFARRVLSLCRRLGFVARVAVADNAAAAHALARSAGEAVTICPPGEASARISALPLSALRIDPASAEKMRRLGIDTAGELTALPRAPLVRRFGRDVALRLDEAEGSRAQPLDLVAPLAAPSARLRFAEPIMTVEAIDHALSGLADELATVLMERGLGARLVSLTLTRIDAVDQRIAIGLARPSRDAVHMHHLLGTKIETIEPGFGIEIMRLVAERYDVLAPQPVRSSLADRENSDLGALVDRLATRLGWCRLYRKAGVQSDVPERSWRRLDPLAEAAVGWEEWPRPVRLLDPPEPVKDVMALMPDGIPRRFTWRGRSHLVMRGDGPERIHGEWWRRSAERDAVRDYFQVEDDAGARFWLYRRGDGLDGRTGDMSWHLHGLFG